jgi:broad specificity phosphatase PhoE
MSRVLLVRHAQASFSTDPSREFKGYDQLSPLGERQAEVLGTELAGSGARPERVVIGPLQRHVQTHDLVADVYRSKGLAWPKPELSEPFREHQGATIVRRALARPDYDTELVRLREAFHSATAEAHERRRIYFRAFRRVTRQWANRSLPPDIATGEDWQAFRSRVAEGLGRILESVQEHETVAVFTSGGPVGSAVASVLGLDDEQALELAWMVQNATVTELWSDGSRTSLRSFNVHPQIGNPELVTDV